MPAPALTVSNFRDVSDALAEPLLSLGGGAGARAAGVDALGPAMLDGSVIARHVPAMRERARQLVRALPHARAVDLVAAFAEPWSRDAALSFAGRESDAGARILELSRQVFVSAAHATDRHAALAPSDAMHELAAAFGAQRSPMALQGFVALAHTLPLLLAGAWRVLAMQPGAWDALRDGAVPRAAAIEELLRLASPSRALFRCAMADTHVGGRQLRAGDEVILAIGEANRCARQFVDADSFMPARFEQTPGGERHVGLGRAPHACSGGALVRVALEIATSALLDEFDALSLAGTVRWLGGFAIDGPVSLPVVLRRRSDGEAQGGVCPG